MSESQQGERNHNFGKSFVGKDNPFYGRHHSVATKKRLSESRRGKRLDEAARKKISAANSGERHYNWHGGRSFEPYPVDWTNTLKRSIRERDRYTCQMCGEQQSDKAFDVHHIDKNKKNCDPANLVTLCRKCHFIVHRRERGQR